MLAATYQGIETIRVIDRPEPRIQEPGDAIVEVEVAGLCGSDLHPWSGREPGLDPGTTMGHEFTGSVVATGEAVQRFRTGSPVLSPFSTSCGECAPCRRGLSARCRRGNVFGWVSRGKGLEGAQTRLVRVPLAESTLIERPPGISAVEGLLLGDVVSTGFFAVERAGVSKGGVVAVLGLGAVGLSAVLAARDLGARSVVGVDGIPERLALASAFGAAIVELLDGRGVRRPYGDIAAEARRHGDEDGFECVVDAVGSPEATRLAMELLRPGGFLSIVGVHTEEAFAVSPVAAYDGNLTLAIGRCPVRSRLERLCERQIASRFPIERLVTHRLPLADAPRAYRLFAARDGGAVKILFDVR